MKWEELTAAEFESAVARTGGVCLLPIGVLEKHGNHLPLGTDGLSAYEISVQAAGQEPAMVFPPYYFGSIAGARHQPGTVSLPLPLLVRLLEAVCDEISRNGFKKILIVNGHGGNASLLEFFRSSLLHTEKDYLVYFSMSGIVLDDPVLESGAVFRGHADEGETSVMMYLKPELVKNNGIPAGYGYYHDGLKSFRDANLSTPVNWYAGFPGHLCGDRTPGTTEKGEILVRKSVRRIVDFIQLIKRDDTPVRLYHEFHRRSRLPQAGYGEDEEKP